MSGVTCQFCGKPLWRIRRGSDGDFCSRDHRNQYKLRMGLSQLAEAEKASAILRRSNICNTVSLGKAAGGPETQRRRFAAAAMPHPGQGIRVASAQLPSPFGLRYAPPAMSAPARRLGSQRLAKAAVAFTRQGPQLRPVCPALFDTRGPGAIRPPRVRAVDGALSRPVFLIARFPRRRPAVHVLELPWVPRQMSSSLRAPECRPRTSAPPERRPSFVGFPSGTLRLPATAKKADLADLPCVPQALMPYRVGERAPDTQPGNLDHLTPLPLTAAVLRQGPGGLITIRAASARADIYDVETWHLDGLRARRLAQVAPESRVPALPVIASRTEAISLPGGSCRSLPAPSFRHIECVRRSVLVARSLRPLSCGRRAGWTGRVRLPGGTPRQLPAQAANIRPARRAKQEMFGPSLAGPSLPPLSWDEVSMPAAEAVPIPAGARMRGRARVLELPAPGRELLIAPFRPALRGGLSDPIPGQAIHVIEDHFAAGLASWCGDTSGWKLDMAGVRPAAVAIFTPSLPYPDYRLECLARVEQGSLSCLVRATGEADAHVVRIPNGGGVMERYTVISGNAGERSSAALSGIPPNKSLNVRIDVHGSDFAVSVNGLAIDRWSDSRLPSGGIGFGSSPADRVRLYWVKLTCRMPENSGSETSQT